MDGVYGTHGVKLGRVFGIEIGFDYSWIFIVVLLTWSLTSGFLYWHPDWSAGLAFGTALVAALLFFASVLLHELAHSLVARRFGVPVRNITLFLFGGVSNIEREPPSPKAEFLTAVVGPLTSIVIGVALLALGAAVTRTASSQLVDPAQAMRALGPGASLLMWLGPINILVGVFNLIPAFPLDGGRILRSIIWGATKNLHAATRWASAVGQAFGWFFVFMGVAMAFGASVPFFGRGLVPGLWLAFIGWFLSSAAAATWRRQLVQEVLAGVPVSRLMRPVAMHVRPDVLLDAFVYDSLMRTEERAFPVMDDDGKLMGMVTLYDVREVPRDRWHEVRVGDVMTPIERLVTVSPRDEGPEALEKLARANVSQLPVVDRGQLVGMLHRSDIARWIELHMQVQQPRGWAH